MKLSFGNRIPISTTRIYNKQNKKFEQATLYELTGHDENDINEIVYNSGEWRYKFPISVGLYDKRKKLASSETLSEFDRMMLDGSCFYVLKTENGKTAAMCQTQNVSNASDIIYLESSPDRQYGFAGQAMLASIAKQMLKKPNAYLMIDDPALRAMDFYTKTCGFTKREDNSLGIEMDEETMRQFVNNVEKRTQASITDVED